MKLYITVGVFPDLNQQGGPHQEHISKKKLQEVAHKFFLLQKPMHDCSAVATEHARVTMTVYPCVIGITLPWSSRLLTHEPAQLQLLTHDRTCNHAKNCE